MLGFEVVGVWGLGLLGFRVVAAWGLGLLGFRVVGFVGVCGLGLLGFKGCWGLGLLGLLEKGFFGATCWVGGPEISGLRGRSFGLWGQKFVVSVRKTLMLNGWLVQDLAFRAWG